MKTSDLTAELDSALSKFQGEMPAINKESNVSMKGTSRAGKEYSVDYEYAPLEDIQTIANPILAKHGLNVTQDLDFEFSPSGNILHLIATRTAHSSGQYKISKWPLDMTGVTKEQDRGSKITFNKRYAFAAALNIILKNEDNDAQGVLANQSVSQEKIKKDFADNKAKQNIPKKPEDFFINVGKNKGKKIGDLDKKQIEDMLITMNTYYSKPENKSSLKEAQPLIDAANARLIDLIEQENELNGKLGIK